MSRELQVLQSEIAPDNVHHFKTLVAALVETLTCCMHRFAHASLDEGDLEPPLPVERGAQCVEFNAQLLVEWRLKGWVNHIRTLCLLLKEVLESLVPQTG